MEIVVNQCYGGFSVSQEFQELYPQYNNAERTDPAFISALRNFGLNEASGLFAQLAIVEIPAEATDWELDEYDGWEGITYVVDGKIYHA